MDTCREYILPLLHAADWRDEQVLQEHFFTDGRIVPTVSGHRREPGKRADWRS